MQGIFIGQGDVMTTKREEIRMALASRNQAAFAVAIARCVAREELAGIDQDTRAWWEAPEPSCDGVNCGHDHKLVGAILEGLLER